MAQGPTFFTKWKEKCLEEKEFYLNWGSPLMDEALRGVQGGVSIIISGMPNFGKSQLATNTLLRLMEHNDDAIVIDFSLDDGMNKRLTQYVASLSKLDMNLVDFANKIESKEAKNRFDAACVAVQTAIEQKRLFIYDSSEVDGQAQYTMKFLSDKVEEIRKAFPDRKLIVALDSLNDIETDARADDHMLKSESTAKQLNRLITNTDSVLIATSHLRKNGGRAPTLEDVKGNSYLAYSAKVVIGVHNDMKVSRDKCKIFWNAQKPGSQEIIAMPVLEAHFLKSKVSAFNGVVAFKQYPSQGRCVEAEGETQKVLQSLIYERV